jgi:hypothetical protein
MSREKQVRIRLSRGRRCRSGRAFALENDGSLGVCQDALQVATVGMPSEMSTTTLSGSGVLAGLCLDRGDEDVVAGVEEVILRKSRKPRWLSLSSIYDVS